MNKLLIIIIIIVSISLAIYYLIGFNVDNISAADVKQKINHSNSNIGIIDVRTKKEYDSGIKLYHSSSISTNTTSDFFSLTSGIGPRSLNL